MAVFSRSRFEKSARSMEAPFAGMALRAAFDLASAMRGAMSLGR